MEGKHDTIDVWVTQKNNSLFVLLTNFALPKHKIEQEEILFKIKTDQYIISASVETIDEHSANAVTAWKKIGKPQTLLPKQVLELLEISGLKSERVDCIKSPMNII